MFETEETTEDEGDRTTEATGTERRDIDIEDQGRAVDAGAEVDPTVEAVEAGGTERGPKGEGAMEATQKAGEAATEVVDAGETGSGDE